MLAVPALGRWRQDRPVNLAERPHLQKQANNKVMAVLRDNIRGSPLASVPCKHVRVQTNRESREGE